jgi:hypothetical protein
MIRSVVEKEGKTEYGEGRSYTGGNLSYDCRGR